MNYTKICIFGSRAYCRKQKSDGMWHYDNAALTRAFALFDVLFKDVPNPYFIVGKAHGADMVGMYYAIARNLHYEEFIPDWDSEPRRGGMMRNTKMREAGHQFVGFWDGTSKGTGEMVTALKRDGRPLQLFNLDNGVYHV